MARNGSGTYNLPAGNPVTTGTTISSTWANSTLSDMATALTGSIASDGQTTASGNLPMGGFIHTNVGNATVRANYASAAQVQDNAITYLTSVAGTNTITAVGAVGMTAYATGQRFTFVSAGANTGAATININSIGAKALTKNGTTALSAGDIPSGAAVEVVYDGTQFQVVSAMPVTATGDVVGPASATDNAVVRFDATTGKLIQNSVVIIADTTGDVTGVGNLTASGNLTAGGVATIGAGSVSAPSLTTTGDTNTGVFFPAADTVAIGTGGSERMRTDSSGNLLFGTTATWGTAGSGNSFYVANNSDIETVRISNADSGSSPYNLIGFYRNKGASAIAKITTDGSTVAYNTSSDYRLKESIEPITNALSAVEQLKPVNWIWKESKKTGQGFVAHELATVVPFAVTGEKDAVDSEGNPIYQGIDTSFLVAILTAAIQELKTIVDAQAQEIKALQSK
jgi:hypothetical protein